VGLRVSWFSLPPRFRCPLPAARCPLPAVMRHLPYLRLSSRRAPAGFRVDVTAYLFLLVQRHIDPLRAGSRRDREALILAGPTARGICPANHLTIEVSPGVWPFAGHSLGLWALPNNLSLRRVAIRRPFNPR
jgi:hypothetical protein